MSERLLAEDIQRNRIAQMRGVTYLLLAACEGSSLYLRSFGFGFGFEHASRVSVGPFALLPAVFLWLPAVIAFILQTSQHHWPILSTYEA
jgi:hypothetical protein